MNAHPRAAAVAQASEDIGIALNALQREHGLTDIEMFQAVLTWHQQRLEGMLMAGYDEEG